MDQSKICAVTEWLIPKTVKELFSTATSLGITAPTTNPTKGTQVCAKDYPIVNDSIWHSRSMWDNAHAIHLQRVI